MIFINFIENNEYWSMEEPDNKTINVRLFACKTIWINKSSRKIMDTDDLEMFFGLAELVGRSKMVP